MARNTRSAPRRSRRKSCTSATRGEVPATGARGIAGSLGDRDGVRGGLLRIGAVQPAPHMSVLMPIYNEIDTFERAIAEVLEADLGVDIELIVVDDGSTDGTRERLFSREWPDNVQLHKHEANAGKGAAVRTALQHARGEISAIMDADLEYDPEDLKTLLPPLQKGLSNAAL